MKTLSFIFLILIIKISPAQIGIKFVFFDGCSNTFIIPTYEVVDSNHQVIYHSLFDKESSISIPNAGIYIVHVFLENGIDYGTRNTFSIIIEEDKQVADTLYIPDIRFRFEPILHPPSDYFEYVNCGVPCNGKEICYYPNGKKQIEGEFVNGKPLNLRKYDEDGFSGHKTTYNLKSHQQTKVEYFDEDGEIYEVDVWKYKRKKIIIKSYNGNGKLIESKITRSIPKDKKAQQKL